MTTLAERAVQGSLLNTISASIVDHTGGANGAGQSAQYNLCLNC